MGKETVYVQYHSNMKAFEPVTGGEFNSTSSILGFPGNGKVANTYSLLFAFKNKTAAQVRKSLKVSISNATGGALITSATTTAASGTSASPRPFTRGTSPAVPTRHRGLSAFRPV
jgi:hypothetical protein